MLRLTPTLFSSALALAIMPAAAIAQSEAAQAEAHAGHTGQAANHSEHAEHAASMADDVAGAEAVLVDYRESLTARDADAMIALFAEDSAVFENGKDEGSFSHYMEHHLAPELDAITSFTFSEPTVSVKRMGHMAFGHETYNYRIELTDGRVIEREGVATSVLRHDAGGWKIVQYHSSSRAPRNP